VSGFLVFAGLVVYGSMVNPFFLVNPSSLVLILIFSVSWFSSEFRCQPRFWVAVLRHFCQLTPFGVDLDDVNKSPIAVGIYLFGYEVFLGLIVYGSLMIPLG